ncbi:hypothetical protein JOD57_000108 [Geodermatophilus bullaregiensis]|uniref:hypothetical protein n=1 Tax=Geodermatophilus bullaregiensis TaxID=1564160 RepID=UPI00195EE52F|nr:hypothetical protein [Geodermatophilus bullaregiensis]MBM7804271.1 hypothetical protein [Geodermatophilus bullaregiensis]
MADEPVAPERDDAGPGGPAAPVAVDVPHVPGRRRRWALAGAGALVVGVCGLATGASLAALASGERGWGVVVAMTFLVIAALTLFSRVRQNGAGELSWDGRVLAGRTLLGWHGVDATRVYAVAVVDGDGGPTGLLLADDRTHLRVSWYRLGRLPHADRLRAALLERQDRHALDLPLQLCTEWGLTPVPGAPAAGRLPGDLRDPADGLITALTVVGTLVTVVGAGLQVL